MKNIVRKVLYDETAYSSYGQPPDDWPPEKLMDFQSWLSAMIATIPEPLRDTARIEFKGGRRDGDDFANAAIFYHREETDEEEQKREAREQWEKAAREGARQRDAHFLIARTIKSCSAEQKRLLLDLLKKECGE